MTTTMCNNCATPLKNSKYYQVTYRDATDHDKEEKIKKLQEGNEEEIKKKEKKLESYRAELRELDDDELNEVLESLRAELDEMKEKLKDETEEEKKEKKASLEHLGVDSTVYKTKNYSVLQLKQFDHNTAPGDKLLMRLGSKDDDTTGDSSGDELLKKLGSVD